MGTNTQKKAAIKWWYNLPIEEANKILKKYNSIGFLKDEQIEQVWLSEKSTVEKPLQLLASLLEKEGLRKYTCITSGWGYSQVERDIVTTLTNWQKEQIDWEQVFDDAQSMHLQEFISHYKK